MQIVSIGDNLYEIQILLSGKNEENVIDCRLLN